MPTQWDRRDLALLVRDSIQFALSNFDELSTEAQRNITPFRDVKLIHDEMHPNVVYLRLADGSAYRATLIQTQPANQPQEALQQEEAAAHTRRTGRRAEEGAAAPTT